MDSSSSLAPTSIDASDSGSQVSSSWLGSEAWADAATDQGEGNEAGDEALSAEKGGNAEREAEQRVEEDPTNNLITSFGYKIRPRGSPGPDARISPAESAITAAIRRSKGRGCNPIFYPAKGTTFNSAQEARDFYNLYSWEVGFGIRYGKSKKTNGYRTKVDITCSCEDGDQGAG